jgi:uncharacterized protein YabN with tetrapyrrole methylase and pyrophosphatase domain
MGSGSLTVVGTGIRAGVHLTPEAQAAIEEADELLYVASDPIAATWLDSLHTRARSLNGLYRFGEVRRDIYEAMVKAILEPVRDGGRVCVAFYGHPGVFVYPSNEAIRQARAEGLPAKMLPAVSAEDCLFADLGVDPARHGCQSFDATDFLVRRRAPDNSAALILWQVGFIAAVTYEEETDRRGLAVLREYLREHYPPEHEVVLYAGSPYPIADAHVERLPLERLAEASVDSMFTLYVAPCRKPEPDLEMLERLGMEPAG